MDLQTIEREHLIRGVPPRAVYDVVTDYPRYPHLFSEMTSARVLGYEGDKKRVEFRAKVVVEVRYVIDIVHDEEKLQTSWSYVEGEVVTDSKGGWTFEPEGDSTRIKYRAGLAVNAPLPKFVVNKVANALMAHSIPNMFKALEREVRSRR
ncbi:MAG: SRPBCC family protein [Deltaproteobacteria bacterium]|nr:SRPBCC family protein [Deltaproteobacteria bacterium]